VLIEELGLGPEGLSVRRYAGEGQGTNALADATRLTLDHAVRDILDTQRERARKLLLEKRELLVAPAGSVAGAQGA